ncbi:MAG: FHA domain-containing protein [bacterium]
MKLSLLIIDPEGQAKQWPLASGMVRLGRGKANDLIIVGRGVSRNHAELTVAEDTLRIEDLDSTYGTKVNGRQIRTAQLAVGDHIDIGVFRLVLVPLAEPLSSGPGRGRSKRQDFLTEPPGGGRFDEVTTSVVTSAEEVVIGLLPGRETTRETDPSGFSEEISGVHQVRESQLNVRFVRGGLAPASQSIDFSSPLGGSPGERMVDRVESLARALAGQQVRESQAESSDLASLLLVYRAAELMPRAIDLSAYLDQVLDLLVTKLGITTAVLVRRDEVGQLRAVSVRHQDPLKKGEIPVSRAVVDEALETGQPVFSSDLRTDPSFGHRDSVMAYKVGALLVVPLMLREKPVGALYLSRAAGSSFDRTETETVLGISALLAKAVSLQEMEHEAMEQRRRCRLLERFHAPEVLEAIYAPEGSVLGLEHQTGTVLQLRIDGFDTLVSERDTAAVADVVVAIRSLVHEAVFGNGGTIVWLHECSGMAIFGGQSTAESDAAWALSAAMELQREYRNLSRQLRLSGEMELRIGLDRGALDVGVLGPSDRLQYSALGEVVIRAKRACELGRAGVIHATQEALSQIPNPRGTVTQVDSADPLLPHAVFEITL